jgi:hypothetical protein
MEVEANPNPSPYAQLRKSFVAGGVAFNHRQQPLVGGDKCPRGIHQLLRVHL